MARTKKCVLEMQASNVFAELKVRIQGGEAELRFYPKYGASEYVSIKGNRPELNAMMEELDFVVTRPRHE
jgi:hypothetical protein